MRLLYKKRYFDRISTIKYNNPQDYSVRAIDVLHAQMMFYHKEGPEILNKIIAAIREDFFKRNNYYGMPRDMVFLNKLLAECPDKATEIAAVLANYESPKLERITKTEKKDHRFVVVAPTAAYNADDWLDKIAKDKPKLLPPNELKELN